MTKSTDPQGGRFIRFILVGLPVGILLLGIGSMMWTQLKPPAPEVDENFEKFMSAAKLNRRLINRPDIERYVSILTEEIGSRSMGEPEALQRAGIWIESTLRGGNLGYKVKRQTYHIDGVDVRNLIAELPGEKKHRDEVIIIGAHYDTVANCPGANDNATGVAAVLSLAGAFAGQPQSRTVRFIFFGNQQGADMQAGQTGGKVYAKKLVDDNETVVAMLSIEAIGLDREGSRSILPELVSAPLPKEGDFLVFVGDEISKYWSDSARSVFNRGSNMPAVSSIKEMEWGDHRSFAAQNFPSVLLTSPYEYPHRHEPTDIRERVDLDRLTEACKGVEQVIRAWANP